MPVPYPPPKFQRRCPPEFPLLGIHISTNGSLSAAPGYSCLTQQRAVPFLTLAAVSIKVCILLRHVWRTSWVFLIRLIKRRLAVAVIPLIQQTYFFASLDTLNATDGFGRCANTLKFGQN